MQINPFNSQGNHGLGGVHQKSMTYMRKKTWFYISKYITLLYFSYKQGMQNKMLFTLLNLKTHIGITVILQEQNIITYLKDLQPWNNSCFHIYVRIEEEVWSYPVLRDQYFTAIKEVNSTSNMV